MRTRTPADRLGREAVKALESAIARIGLRTSRPTSGADFEVHLPDGGVLVVEVKAATTPTVDRARGLAEQAGAGSTTVVVADQITAPVRAALNDAGVGWLDRRGHLRLVAPGCFIDTDMPAIPRRGPGQDVKREAIAGRSGLAAAASLLVRPDDPMGVGQIALAASLNPSSITRALARLADAHLAERLDRGRYRPLVPELFWALVAAWPREHVAIRWHTPPEHDDRLAFWDDDLTKPGWAAAGVPGAMAWGAPLVATADFPIHLYAPDEQLVRDAAMLHADGAGTQALLSVDPIGLITAERYHAGSLAWPVAHPLFCALDLTEAARDREALEQWSPPPEFERVW
jgi:hypothetical protein